MSWDWDKIVSTKTAARETVSLIMDRAWGQRLGEVQLRHGILQEQVQRSPGDTALLAEIEELTTEIEQLTAEKPDKVCDFVFRSIAPGRYERLVNAHPPTQQQRQRAAKRGQQVAFNEDTFPQALVKACLVSPRLTSEQVDEMWQAGTDSDDPDDPDAPVGERFSSGELAALFQTAQVANVGRPRVE